MPSLNKATRVSVAISDFHHPVAKIASYLEKEYLLHAGSEVGRRDMDRKRSGASVLTQSSSPGACSLLCGVDPISYKLMSYGAIHKEDTAPAGCIRRIEKCSRSSSQNLPSSRVSSSTHLLSSFMCYVRSNRWIGPIFGGRPTFATKVTLERQYRKYSIMKTLSHSPTPARIVPYPYITLIAFSVQGTSGATSSGRSRAGALGSKTFHGPGVLFNGTGRLGAPDLAGETEYGDPDHLRDKAGDRTSRDIEH